MDIVYENPSNEIIDSYSLLVFNTLFSSSIIPEFADKEKFALHYHQKYGEKNIKDLCKSIGIEIYKYSYCNWCRDYDKNNIVLSYKSIIFGNDGKSMNQYKCVLCRRCNEMNRYIEKLNKEDKLKILYKEIGHLVYNDKKWCRKCIDEWYN